MPVSAFDLSSPREAARAFHYLNTQPLSPKANRAKRNSRWGALVTYLLWGRPEGDTRSEPEVESVVVRSP